MLFVRATCGEVRQSCGERELHLSFFSFFCWGGGIFYEEEGNGLENRQSNINKHRKQEKHSYSGLRLASAVTRSTGEKTA